MRHDWDDSPDEEEDGEDWDELSEHDPEAEDHDSPTIECHMCGAEIYADAYQCPICSEYVKKVPERWQNRPKWWVILGILGILASLLAALHPFW